MAKIVLGVGTSHTPLLALDGERWNERAQDDLKNEALVLSDGRTLSYRDLEVERGQPYRDDATTENFVALHRLAQEHLDHLADEIEAARPDVVLIIGDDQDELFGKDNMPAVAVYYGAEVAMHVRKYLAHHPAWRIPVDKIYAMDRPHVFAGHPPLAEHIIRHLIAAEVDIGVARTVPEPEKNGFGHAYGFVVQRLFKGRPIPVVPVLLNTYFPPNTPVPGRCFDIGQKIADAIAGFPDDLRVVVIASGGLSHFVTDADLDHRVLDGMRNGNGANLRDIPLEALLSGSSEIRNWIMMGGAVADMTCDWCEYIPVYRTPAGTGIGMGFATWKPDA